MSFGSPLVYKTLVFLSFAKTPLLTKIANKKKKQKFGGIKLISYLANMKNKPPASAAINTPQNHIPVFNARKIPWVRAHYFTLL